MKNKILFGSGAFVILLATAFALLGVWTYQTEAAKVLSVFSPLVYPLAFVLILSAVVIIHEGGHFFAARMCGIKVTAFSVGFGKKIWSRVDKKAQNGRFVWCLWVAMSKCLVMKMLPV